MTYEFVPFASPAYFACLAGLFFSRGMDMFSTWIGTPNLECEGNPVAKWLGWRRAIVLNITFCAALAVWPLPAIMTSVMSLLVAARNFQAAWMMRTMGEERYAMHICEQLRATRPALFVFCIGAQSLCVAAVGAALMCLTPVASIAFAIGTGAVGFAIVNIVYSVLSIWRLRRA